VTAQPEWIKADITNAKSMNANFLIEDHPPFQHNNRFSAFGNGHPDRRFGPGSDDSRKRYQTFPCLTLPNPSLHYMLDGYV
jgi:hypothetical protein